LHIEKDDNKGFDPSNGRSYYENNVFDFNIHLKINNTDALLMTLNLNGWKINSKHSN